METDPAQRMGLSKSRRTVISILGIICITILGLYQGNDVSWAILGIVSTVVGANATQKVFERRKQ